MNEIMGTLLPSLSFGVFGMNRGIDDFRSTTAASTPSSSSRISLTGEGPLSGDVLARQNSFISSMTAVCLKS